MEEFLKHATSGSKIMNNMLPVARTDYWAKEMKNCYVQNMPTLLQGNESCVFQEEFSMQEKLII